MDPIFIYFSKIDLKDNNKFTLDFPDEQNVEELIFLKNRDYYFISLNCNLIVKEHIDDKKRLIKELSQKSRLLSCWKYEYYDLVQKKIYLLYTYFITRGFTFLHDQKNYYHVRFNDANRLIISNFYHRRFNSL